MADSMSATYQTIEASIIPAVALQGMPPLVQDAWNPKLPVAQ